MGYSPGRQHGRAVNELQAGTAGLFFSTHPSLPVPETPAPAPAPTGRS